MWLFDSLKTGIENFAANAMKSKEERLNEALKRIPDPFAKEIPWTPLVRWWSSLRTNILIVMPNWNLEYKLATWIKIFSWIFILVGLVYLVTFPTVTILSGNWENVMIIPFLLFPGIFWGMGYYTYQRYNKPITFDNSIGYFYKWKPSFNYWMIDINDKNLVPFNDIYAIQLLTEHVMGNKSSYYSYELNLVLKDKTRINVVDFWNIGIIRKDAKTIWDFLWVPVWDLSELNNKLF